MLVGGDSIYFELDPLTGNLTEAGTRNVGADVCSLDVGAVPKGKSQSLFATVGCHDSMVNLLSLVPRGLLEQRSSTALGNARPHSVVLSNAVGWDGGKIMLTVGLNDGLALTASINLVTGAILTSPSRFFLGARPVMASHITLCGLPSTLLLLLRLGIDQAWNCCHMMAPMSYAPLDYSCLFSNKAMREGIVAMSGKTLRILSVSDKGGGS